MYVYWKFIYGIYYYNFQYHSMQHRFAIRDGLPAMK